MPVFRARSQTQRFVLLSHTFGLPAAVLDVCNRALRKLTFKKRHFVHLAGYEAPICQRYDTSDNAAFHQVFIQQEYSCLDDVHDPLFIVDLGANVGYASLYFLNWFPRSRVVAVEPDKFNFDVCKLNLSPYPGRAQTKHAAVWSHECKLVACPGSYRDKAEWATQVRERLEGETPGITAITVPQLLQECGAEVIDILKVDIERAEAVLFSGQCDHWLGKVRNIVIELHDDECERIFFNALASYRYDLSRSGELTVCRNLIPKNPQ